MTRMDVCVDVQPAVAQRAGVGRYTHQLVLHLAAASPADRLALFYFDYRRRGLPFRVEGVAERAVRWCPGRAMQWAWKTLGAPAFERLAGPADVYHFTNFIIPPMRRGRAVVSIHDMSFLRHPEFAEERNLRHLRARIGATAHRAAAIVTISRFSAAEIAELLNVDPARIHVIYPGIAETFQPPPPGRVDAVRHALGLQTPYLLTVGTLEPRKNVEFLVDVFERMPGYAGQLVVAGMPGWKYEATRERMRTSPRAADIRYLQYVADDDLPALYAGADAFLVASHYEGFGFPPVEAMACGTPVVSSTGGSLAEVLGDAAVVIPEYDAERWASETLALLSDTARRCRLAEAGRRQAAQYTWQSAARQHWDVYRKAAS